MGKYTELINELRNIEVAIKITQNKNGANTIDNVYRELDTDIRPLNKTSAMWKCISDYVVNTHAPTHNYKVELVDVYEISRINESKDIAKVSDKVGNKYLLWHGTRMTNYCSILKNGLILNPEQLGVVITGKMFGQGVYFSDTFSKSFNYTAYDTSDNYGALLLCEVALGNQLKQVNANYNITRDGMAKQGYYSTWGIGQTTPSGNVIVDNVKIPNQKLKQTTTKTVLLYNEYIVYDTNQVSLKYIVIVKKI